jgi:hypothetical protein
VSAADLRFQRLCAKVHRLGPRVMCELLDELSAERLIRQPIETKLERYAALDPVTLRALGADQFPTNPLHLIHRGDNNS